MQNAAALERLAILTEQRAMLRRYGWGGAPALDRDIAAAEVLANAQQGDRLTTTTPTTTASRSQADAVEEAAHAC